MHIGEPSTSARFGGPSAQVGSSIRPPVPAADFSPKFGRIKPPPTPVVTARASSYAASSAATSVGGKSSLVIIHRKQGQVFSHIRDLTGIIASVHASTDPRLTRNEDVPSFGVLLDDFLDSQGYTPTSIRLIAKAFHDAGSDDDVFAQALVDQGVPFKEASYMWRCLSVEQNLSQLGVEFQS